LWRTYGRVLLFYLCYGISLLVPLLIGILLCLPFLFLLALGAEHRILYSLPWVGMAAVLGWFYLRMLLGQYLFLFRIEEPLWSNIIDGFQMMKGKVASFLLIQLAVVLLSLFYILPALVIGRADGGFLWSVVISLLGDMVIVPFSVLLSSGFASEVLQQQGVYDSLEPDGQG